MSAAPTRTPAAGKDGGVRARSDAPQPAGPARVTDDVRYVKCRDRVTSIQLQRIEVEKRIADEVNRRNQAWRSYHETALAEAIVDDRPEPTRAEATPLDLLYE